MHSFKVAVVLALAATLAVAGLIAQAQRGQPAGRFGGTASVENGWTATTAEAAQERASSQPSRPPGGRPLEGFPGRWGARGPRGGGFSSLGSSPLAKDAAEKQILETAARVTPFSNVPMEDGRMIRLLTEAIGAKEAVEIGTSTGYSGLWLALALRNTGGRLTTFEIDPGRAAEARQNFRKAGVEGIVTVVEGDAHQTIKKLRGPIDIVFIDADKEGYRDYLEKLLPLLRPGGLILAHNVSGRGENPEYVEAVTTNPQLETLLVTSQMAITLKKR